MEGSLPMELDNEKAQILRKLLNPTLAKPNVDEMSEMVFQKVRKFSDQAAERLEKMESINMRPLFQVLTVSKPQKLPSNTSFGS
jgi:cytochrome P450